MERKTRLKFKMIISLCTCVLSLFSLISLTLAWFAMNEKTDAGGMNVVVGDDSIVKSCEYFVADSTKTGSDYLFIPAESDDKNKLGAYDVLNDRYQFLIKINLSVTKVTITANTATDYFLGSSTAKKDGHGITANGTGNVLSSIVSFSVLNVGENVGDLQPTENGYALNALPEKENAFCFFDRDALSTATKPERSIPLADSLTAGTAEDGETCVFVMVSYDPLLASTVFLANIGNEVLEQTENDTIPFVLDFTIIVSAG